MENSNIITLSLPKPLVEKIEKRIEGTSFDSVSSYITYVLTEILSEEKPKVMSEEDEKNVKEKLKDLGYMD